MYVPTHLPIGHKQPCVAHPLSQQTRPLVSIWKPYFEAGDETVNYFKTYFIVNP